MTGNKQSGYKHIFGPVPSRRLGVSLGVDLMLQKTCTLDCVYCECGKTTHLTLNKKQYVPVDEIKKELSRFLANGPKLDHITFSGSGEPTLHSGIGEIISFVKSGYPQYKIALLTNGSLLYQPEVTESILDVDIAIVSLDAVSETIFNKINRPHPKLEASRIVEGLISFRERFINQYWIELFIVPGINDGINEMKKIQKTLRLINPDKVQLNTLDRPGTENWVVPAHSNMLAEAKKLFNNTSIVKHVEAGPNTDGVKSGSDHLIFSTLMRRPCTVNDISRILGTCREDVFRLLEDLVKKGRIEKKKMQRGVFYRIIN